MIYSLTTNERRFHNPKRQRGASLRPWLTLFDVALFGFKAEGLTQEVVRRLVMLGAKLDICNEKGLTALDEAKQNKDLDADFIQELEQIAASRKNKPWN